MKFFNQDTLKPLQEKYEEYQNLVKAAASDPPTEPYKSKYAAFDKLHEINELLKTIQISDIEYQMHIELIRCHVILHSGTLKSETDEPSAAEQLLKGCLTRCDEISDPRFTVYCRVSAHNQLGIIWFNRDDMEKSRSHLETALSTFAEFTNDPTNNFWLMEDLFYPDKYQIRVGDDASIGMLLTHSYYYLAQVHAKLGNTRKSAEYCHTTLARQLRYSEYDPVDWCANASTLSQFYINQENFKSARYHLLCAKIIFEKHFANYAETLSEDKKETVEGCEAHINRLCGKYGACILEYSQNHSLLSKVYKALENVENPDDEAIENPEFDTIDVKDKLDEVTDSKITSWDEAKKTFLWAQKHYTSSQNYYSLNERCSDYVEITRDISQLYKHLISFETDNDRACKMHRRRADLLEPLNEKLSHSHYLLVIRQILFELGEIFSDMMDLKTKRWNEEPDNPHHAKKVNLMVSKAINYFIQFLDTMKTDGKHPDKYNDESVRPALLARFHLGRLSSKFVVDENTEQHLRNTLTSFTRYKEIMDYCEENDHGQAAIDQEFEICQEMVRLLPLKIESIKRNLKK